MEEIFEKVLEKGNQLSSMWFTEEDVLTCAKADKWNGKEYLIILQDDEGLYTYKYTKNESLIELNDFEATFKFHSKEETIIENYKIPDIVCDKVSIKQKLGRIFGKDMR